MKTPEERIVSLEEALVTAAEVLSTQNDLITRLTSLVENSQQKNAQLMNVVGTVVEAMKKHQLLELTSAQAASLH